MLKCPRCGGTSITPVGTTHYLCNNPNCVSDDGSRTQFTLEEDDKVCFPYNQIYVRRGKHQFYKTPYLKLKVEGISET